MIIRSAIKHKRSCCCSIVEPFCTSLWVSRAVFFFLFHIKTHPQEMLVKINGENPTVPLLIYPSPGDRVHSSRRALGSAKWFCARFRVYCAPATCSVPRYFTFKDFRTAQKIWTSPPVPAEWEESLPCWK